MSSRSIHIAHKSSSSQLLPADHTNHSMTFNNIKEQVSNFLLERVVSKKDSRQITNSKYKFVHKISIDQRNDEELFLFYSVIHGHFDDLTKRLNQKENDIKKMEEIDLKTKIGEYEEYYRRKPHPLNLEDKVDILRQQLMELSVTEPDMVGANIFHLAYLCQKYDIAHYLVERFPQWAYLPYGDVHLTRRDIRTNPPSIDIVNPYIYPAFIKNMDNDNESLHHMDKDELEKKKKEFERKKIDFNDNYAKDIKDFRQYIKDFLETDKEVDKKISSYSPYTGENILHIAIIQRNVTEVRWLLNFYRDHMHSQPLGLPSLLSSEALGKFFKRRDNEIYFGTTPLQFAITSNDQDIFNLVYSCSCNIKIAKDGNNEKKNRDKTDTYQNNGSYQKYKEDNDSSNFGPYSIFKTDKDGNNALHLCAMNGLTEMYDCVHTTAKQLIIRKLRDIYSRHAIGLLGGDEKIITEGDESVPQNAKQSSNTSILSLSSFPKRNAQVHDISQASSSNYTNKRPNSLIEMGRNSYATPKYKDSDDDILFENFKSPHCLTYNREGLVMPTPEMKESWILKEAENIIKCELVLALNKNLHSPLTLTAAVLSKKPDDNKFTEADAARRSKQIKMLEHLLQFLKRTDWVYGPIKSEVLQLEGIELNYLVMQNYKIDGLKYYLTNTATPYESRLSSKPEPVLHYFMNYYKRGQIDFSLCKVDKEKGEKISECEEWCKILTEKLPKMLPTIDWLCVHEVDEAMIIPEIKDFIEKKWVLMGRPFFMLSFYLHLFIALTITVITCLINFSPSPSSKGSVEIALDILYIIMIAILVIKLFQEIWDIIYHKTIFIHFTSSSLQFPFIPRHKNVYIPIPNLSIHMKYRGITRFDKIMKLVKIFSFLAFCIMKIVSINRHGIHHNIYANQGVKIPLMICVMACWIHMYYFLMCLDSTGPFILSMTKIITNDIPDFLKFYSVVVFAFGCALAMLTNDGTNLNPGNGFFLLLQTIWTLMQQTVQIQNPTHYITQVPEDFPPNLAWIADLLTTAYYGIANIMMLNLLIAILGTTLGTFKENNKGILLLAKYSVMHSFELTMDPEELEKNRKKYAEVSEYLEKKDNSEEAWIKYAPEYIKKILYPPSIINRYDFKLSVIDHDWFNKDAVLSNNNNSHEIHNTLFIIDPQIDFHEGGTLAVKGATEDSKRIAKMIDEYGSHIHEIYVSLDSHYPKHIAHAICWKHKDYKDPKELQKVKDTGKVADDKPYDINFYPIPYTEIKSKDIMNDTWIYQHSLKKDKKDWLRKYTSTLEFKGDFKLTIWPEHCIIGSHGHSIVPVINEALQEWALKSKRPINYVLKGQNIYTEMYSALKAEVEDPSDTTTALNIDLINKFKLSDRLLICGQALSHAVKFTVRDLIDNWGGSELSKIVVLKDASSPVKHCQGLAKEFIHDAEQKGVTVTVCDNVFEGYLKKDEKEDEESPEVDDDNQQNKNILSLSNNNITSKSVRIKRKVIKKPVTLSPQIKK